MSLKAKTRPYCHWCGKARKHSENHFLCSMTEPTLQGIALSKVVDAYKRHQSVHGAAKELGLVGQSVHRFLKRHNCEVNKLPIFTGLELIQIRDYYENSGNDFDLDILSQMLGRPRTSVARIARRLKLTDQSRYTSRMQKKNKEGHQDQWSRHPHPRGFLGGKHSTEALARISKKSRQYWMTAKTFEIGSMSPEAREARSRRMALHQATRPASTNYSSRKHGFRPDINLYVRSSWEANYARYLNLLQQMKVIENWQYEPEVFWFNDIRRGVTSYKPDFRIIYKNDPTPEYVEVKGWVTPKDRTKWARMKKYYPTVKLVVVGERSYRRLKEKWSSTIPKWE